ncbi:MAG TPA: hypothetical protein VIU41_05780 [Geobacteraceae bacterium]
MSNHVNETTTAKTSAHEQAESQTVNPLPVIANNAGAVSVYVNLTITRDEYRRVPYFI